MRTIIALTIVTLAVTACSRDPQLMNITSGQNSPDEFAILPGKPLTMPPDLTALPTPTPGGTNITDPTPLPDAVAALGGNPAALSRQGVAPGDNALIAYAARNGRNASIRAQLAGEDEAWRSANSRRLLETLARTSVYMRAYRPMTLDPHAELERWRRAGARTPTAPPPGQ